MKTLSQINESTNINNKSVAEMEIRLNQAYDHPSIVF